MMTPYLAAALSIGAALLCPIVAVAQPGGSELSAVLACADVEREILRLECYDEAVAAIRSTAPLSSARAADAAPAADTALPSSTSTAENSAAPSAPVVAAERTLPGPALSDTAQQNDGESDARGDQPRQVTIVEVRTNIPSRAVFITSDGAVFVQTSGQARVFFPEVPFQASIDTGAFGGTFLTADGSRRRIRITARD